MAGPGVISDARRRSARCLAEQAHRCPICVKVVYGNGGRAAHFRACLRKAMTDLSRHVDVNDLMAEYLRRRGSATSSKE